jgi:hypothetical protein
MGKRVHALVQNDIYGTLGRGRRNSEHLSMMIPNYIDIPMVDPKTGLISQEWKVIFQQLLSQLQMHAGLEGLDVPQQTNANMLLIQAEVDEFGTQIPPAGRLLFNTSTVNGGTSMAPNGQLYVLLQDMTFHPITNT